jgi:hypothetical protein
MAVWFALFSEMYISIPSFKFCAFLSSDNYFVMHFPFKSNENACITSWFKKKNYIALKIEVYSYMIIQFSSMKNKTVVELNHCVGMQMCKTGCT